MSQQQPGQQPGKTKAIASLVLGIVGIVLDFFFVTIFLSAIGCVLGIVGIIMYSGAKKEGFVGGMATAGLVLSIIAVVFGAGSLLCTVCALGAAGAAGAAGGLSNM